MDDFTKAERLRAYLWNSRSPREAIWRECSRWICPFRGCLDDGLRSEYSDDEDDALTLFTGIASHAVLRGASGMTSGMTPRNSPWFKPYFADENMMELSGAREWLDLLEQRMEDCLSAGGFYQCIQNFNIDLLWAGCALLYSESGAHSPLRFESIQIGSFAVSLDHEGRLDSVARALKMPLAALAEKFGEARLSDRSRAKLQHDPYETVRVWQLCRKAAKGRWPIESLWWEDGARDFLRQSGFFEMPFFFTTWNDGATVYGTGPGDEALPDARQLDILERRKLAGLGKLVEPPVSAPSSLKDVLDLSPGGINYSPSPELIKPILDLSPYAQAMSHIQEEINVVTGRLQDSLMASIFASIPLNQRPRDMSATEFLERKREALQQLGPVISAYEPNVLIPLLQRALMALDRQQKTPPTPPALKEQMLSLNVDFISPMTNALRQSSAEAARSLLTDVASIYSVCQNPEIYDKIDLDQTVDVLATAIGAPGGIVRSDEDVAQIREARAQQQAQQAQAQNVMQQLRMAQVASQLEKDQAELGESAEALE